MPQESAIVEAALDAISAIDRARLSGALGQAVVALKAETKPLQRIALAKRVMELLRQLGDEVAGEAEPETTAEDELSDDPNSPNYRYKDTGYIADSRKERAASMIKLAKEQGTQVRATDVDWDAVEKNPRAAAQLIVKSNLFGKVDWTSLQGNGMDPAAGFLIDRVYAAIAPEPSEDSPRARKDYAAALETIRTRLERSKTTTDVLAILEEIKEELEGAQLNDEESTQYAEVKAQLDVVYERISVLSKEERALGDAFTAALNKQRNAQWEQDKRTRRKWAPDPALAAQIEEAKAEVEAANEARQAWAEAHPEYVERMDNKREGSWEGGMTFTSTLRSGLRDQARELRTRMELIIKGAKIRNLAGSPVTRGWLTFGERFFKLLHYRHFSKGSDAFAGHVANAKSGRIKDWSWADKDKTTVVRTATKREVTFQLKVAEKFERIGGRAINVGSTSDLKTQFGFRDVQSGNWVLNDPNSAKFHVEQTAAAMADMGDILGIDPAALGLGGRLGMAFGARGSGNAGWKGAAKAQYEPVHRVVNLTKMGGGGSLGHEWAHAMDNLLPELSSEKASGKDDFASSNPELLPDGPVRAAYRQITQAMTAGTRRIMETITFNEADRKTAKHNLTGGYVNDVGRRINAAGSAEAAVLAIRAYFTRDDVRTRKLRKRWTTIAAAHYAPEGATEIKVPVGPPRSEFVHGAIDLDEGTVGKYWSSTEELFARAFQSYLEDKLAAGGRRNDYLSVMADNKFYVDPLFGIEWKPYPEGEERTRINAAFDTLFAALREAKTFEKAAANKALLDSIFGPEEGGSEKSETLAD